MFSKGEDSKFAAKEENSVRLHEIEPHAYRSSFQRDRDRILYSKEFRRLSGKTQIFVTGSDDYTRTRLTHTLEVAQIAETISERLGFNSMLTRAIALGHDIGHTPFGHVGERTLNYIMNGCMPYYGFSDNLTEADKGFKHNLQGVRVACCLEQNYDGPSNKYGLNLTKYTLWGIQNHSSLTYKECEFCKNNKECRYKNRDKQCDGKLSVGYYNKLPYKPNEKYEWTFEGIIVAYADEIAQRHHDVEDGIYAGIIEPVHLCDYMMELFSFDEKVCEELKEIKADFQETHYGSKSVAIQKLSRLIVDKYVTDFTNHLNDTIKELEEKLNLSTDTEHEWKEKIYTHAKIYEKSIVKYFGFSDELKAADDKFSEYLFNHILFSNLAQSMDGKASYIIRQLVKAYLTNPQQLLDGTIILIIRDWCNENAVLETDAEKYMTEASRARQRLKDLIKKDDPIINNILLRRICDHIAGMTDQYAMASFERLYGSKTYNF